MDRVSEFVNSPIGLLTVGFLLTTVLGTSFTTWLQRSLTRRQMARQLAMERYREGTHFLNELAELAGQRFFALQRWLWAIQTPGESGDRRTIREEYFALVREWNARVWRTRATLRILIGDRFADAFLDYGDDHRGSPRSLHYRFVRAHHRVLEAERGDAAASTVQQYLGELNRAWSDYVEEVTSLFLRRAVSLELMQESTRSRFRS